MTRQLPVTLHDQTISSNSNDQTISMVIWSYWKLSGDLELLEVIWSLGVTGSFLVIGSYWKFSGHLELLEVVWLLGVTGSFLVSGSYWKLSGQ
jgi:hypothetical protein